MEKRNTCFSRCLVASRNVVAGQTVFAEPSALAVGPSQTLSAQCLVCASKVGERWIKSSSDGFLSDDAC